MKSNKVDLALNVLKFVLGGIGVILCMLIFNGPNGEDTLVDQVAFRDGAKLGATISYTGIIMFACAAIIVLFFFVQLVTNTKKTILSIIGILIALGVYLIIRMMGTDDTNASLALRDPVSDSSINATSAGIYTIFVGLIVSVLVIILGPFMGRLRK